MALIKCKECGHEVSDKAQNCPNCGCPASEFVSSITQELDSDLGGSTETDNVEQKQNEDISDYDTFKKNAKTTDTGYQHEKLLQGYDISLCYSDYCGGSSMAFCYDNGICARRCRWLYCRLFWWWNTISFSKGTCLYH